MWKLEYNEPEFIDWLQSLPPEEEDFVLAVVDAMSASSEHPWYFKGVDDVVVGQVPNPWPMIYKVILRVQDNRELALFIAVDEQPVIADGVTYRGIVHLLVFGELKSLRKRYSIESKAFAELRSRKEKGNGNDKS